MTKYTSRYAELSFYVGGRERKFSGGQYVAQTAEEIAVLDRLVDAIKEPADSVAEIPEATAKPAPKPRKATAKEASGK